MSKKHKNKEIKNEEKEFTEKLEEHIDEVQ